MTRRALRWIETHLDCFDPRPDGDAPDHLRLKGSAELALLCMCLQSQDSFRQPLGIILAFVSSVEQARRGLPVREDAAFVSDLAMRGALRACGVPYDAVEWRAAQRRIRGGGAFRHATLQRLLELRWVFDLGGFVHDVPSYARLYRRTALGKRVSPAETWVRDAYHATHVVFFRTNFGARPFSRSARALTHARRHVGQLLSHYSTRGHWDLVGELLLTMRYLGVGRSGPCQRALAALQRVQLRDGRMPGPGYSRDEERRLRGVARRRYAFRTCYHSTFVAALAGAESGPIAMP